ncbi:hypothetical protein BC828DRAFT_390122 [Blastocladiella britannica]|nr:hypothetical protein BC828DRAFT_390122 [Blastocladiella britannica]
MHDADTYAVVSHNSLRLMLNSLGPLAALLWAGTTVGTVVGAPAGVWDGRTLWDRYTGVQIVDDEVLVSWAGTGVVLASGDAGTAVRALPASLMTSSSFAQSSGIAAADDMLEDDPPSPGFPAGGPAEMFVPPSSYFGGRGSAAAASVAAASAAAGANGANGSRDLLDANDDDLEYDDVSPPPAAPVRDSFFGGRSAVMVGDEDEDDGPEPVYYPFPAGGPSA